MTHEGLKHLTELTDLTSLCIRCLLVSCVGHVFVLGSVSCCRESWSGGVGGGERGCMCRSGHVPMLCVLFCVCAWAGYMLTCVHKPTMCCAVTHLREDVCWSLMKEGGGVCSGCRVHNSTLTALQVLAPACSPSDDSTRGLVEVLELVQLVQMAVRWSRWLRVVELRWWDEHRLRWHVVAPRSESV